LIGTNFRYGSGNEIFSTPEFPPMAAAEPLQLDARQEPGTPPVQLSAPHLGWTVVSAPSFTWAVRRWDRLLQAADLTTGDEAFDVLFGTSGGLATSDQERGFHGLVDA
jgi:hypothetical protein